MSRPTHCEWRPYPWMPKPCFEPVTHQFEGISGDIDTDRYYPVTWYVCAKHAMEGISWGYGIAFSLKTDKVEGVYT